MGRPAPELAEGVLSWMRKNSFFGSSLIEQMSANLAERDAALTTERALSMAAEAEVQEGTGDMETEVLETQRAINKLLDEFQLYRPDTPEHLQYWWRRLQSAKKQQEGLSHHARGTMV